MIKSPTDRRKTRGFTLAELAVVLAIVGILLGGLMVPLTAQLNARNLASTTQTLSEARDALLGFAAANGYLPCPATASSNGLEARTTGGQCSAMSTTTNPTGYLPGATLGLAPTDAQGFVLDAWGARIRYAVTAYKDQTFTTANSLKANWPVPDNSTLLTVCSSAVGATKLGTLDANCASDKKLARSAVAVVFSTGPNKSATPGLDEAENLTLADPLFVSHEPTQAASPGGEFDDLMIWLAEPLLYHRLINAGRLP